MGLRSAWIFLFCLNAIALTARTQELEVQNWFPEHPTHEFLPGKPVSCVIGVRNSAGSTVNITAAVASLNSPYDASVNLYNFTAQPYHLPLGPGQEVSLDYGMFMPFQLPAREFNLKVMLYLSVDDNMFLNLPFNQTINIIEEASWFDLELMGLWVVGLAIVALVGYFITNYLKSLGFVKKAAKKSKKGGPKDGAPVDKDEWLKGTYYDQQKKKAAAKTAKKAE